MMKRKLLHGMKQVCGATSHIMMKDELIVGEHQVDGKRLLFIFISLYTYMYEYYFSILRHKYDVIASCTFLASLLQCIGQNFCIKWRGYFTGRSRVQFRHFRVQLV